MKDSKVSVNKVDDKNNNISRSDEKSNHGEKYITLHTNVDYTSFREHDSNNQSD